jgi:branched-chain amino acid transport system substrate-binding protein
VKQKFRLLSITLTLVSMFALNACSSSTPSANSSGGTPAKSAEGDKGGTIKIGMMTDFSGNYTLTGKLKKMGADVAVEEINSKGGIMGKKLELVVEDSQSTQQGAVAAFQKLASDKEVKAIIGSIRSTDVKALHPYAQKSGIPVAIGGTNIGLTTELKDKWFFRFRPHDGYAAKSIVDFTLNKLGKKKVAIIYDTDAFGSGGKDLLVKEYKDRGIDVLDTEGYNSGTKDYSPFLKKMADSGAEVINPYMTNSEDAGLMMKQLKEKGYNFQVVGASTIAQETTIKVAGDSLNGVYGVNDFALDQSDATKDFVNKFKAKYNETPDIQCAWVYDALNVFDKVIEEKKSTKPEDIRNGILAIKDFAGAEGKYTFDQNGDGLHQYSVIKVENGKVQTVR